MHKILTSLRVYESVLLLLLLLASPVVAASPDAGSKVVKLGYYHEKNFSEGHSAAEIKRGYAYEYYQLLAHYTGWQYEYVYGTYDELYRKLGNGEIDLLGGISYLPERTELMNFPDRPMDKGFYDLVHRSHDSRLNSDLNSLNGVTIGTVTGSITNFMEEFLTANQLHAKIVSYKSPDELNLALRSGQIDAMLAKDTLGDYAGLEAFYRITPAEFYLAVNLHRPDLLAELNAAQQRMSYDHPNLAVTLREKYFRRTAARASLSQPERDWIAEHGMLVIGFVDNTLPLAGSDADGQPTGLVKNYLDQMLFELQLTKEVPVSYRAFSSTQTMLEALAAHQVDAIFPTDNDNWLAEQSKLYPSDKIFSVPMYVMYRDTVPAQQVQHVAICKGNKYHEVLIKLYYPQAKPLFYPTQADCLEAVLQGQAETTILNGYLAAELLSSYHYKGLQSSLLDTREYGFAVASGNSRLLALLNRGIALVNPDYTQNLLQQYNYHPHKTLNDFIHEHLLLVLGLAGIFILLCLIIVFIHVQASRRDHEMTTKLEQALNAAEAASRAKTSFLFNMSHDIRTPMNAILGFNELIRQHIDQRDNILNYVQKVEMSGHFLLTLINNVLDIARIESGHVPVEEKAYDIRLLYQEMATSFEAILTAHRLEVVKDWHITHPVIIGDELKVRQILLNIAGNAVKYTPDGGRIYITVEELPDAREGWCRMRTIITDTGIGMSEEYLPHLFEEFSREHTSTESKVIGTGLGMPIVKKMVDLLGGTIEVRSKLGEGSTFSITLPHRLASADDSLSLSEKEFSPEQNDFSGKRLLLAEDNELNAEIAIELLSSVGFTVDHAADGAICVQMLEQAAPGYYALILMDIQMPNMDGYQATAAIRALPDKTKASIPIAAMTANAFAEDKRKAEEMGMNAHIAKPIDVDVMLKTIAKLL